jgi:5-hydroxyisourate hydrolase
MSASLPTGKLTTHVLDTARGCPAAHLQLDLWRLESQLQGLVRIHLKTVTTNADGRTDQPLLSGQDFLPGVYELVFAVGAYFAKLEATLPEPPFLNQVPIQFGMANPHAHYHVPLLVSPWAYSTYRGS